MTNWYNPAISWREFEERLSWRLAERAPEEPPPVPELPRRAEGEVPWAELHVHSSFSFLDGASDPASLVAEAARLGVEAMAVTDHDGMYGAVQFAQAAHDVGIGTVFGAELSLGLPGPQTGEPDPAGGICSSWRGARRGCAAVFGDHVGAARGWAQGPSRL